MQAVGTQVKSVNRTKHMVEDWTQIAGSVADGLGLALVTILGAVGVCLAQWIEAHVKSKELQTLLLHLDDAATVAVQHIEQDLVKSLKVAASDGVLDANDIRTVQAAALIQA